MMAVAVVSTTSCQNKSESEPAGDCWGHVDYYEDWLFWKYEPDVMSGQIDFEMNQDAFYMLNLNGEKQGAVKFYVSSSKNEVVVPQDIIVYFNGEACPDGSFTFTPAIDGEVAKSDFADDGWVTQTLNLGLEFKDSAAEGEHEYYILYGNECVPAQSKTKNNIRIEGKLLNVDVASLDDVGIYVVKNDISNPVKVAFGWTSVILVALFILSIIISRMMHPTIKVGAINITTEGVYHNHVPIKGYSSVVFTKQFKKQGFFNRLYKKKRLYVVHDSWAQGSDITLLPRGSNAVSIEYGTRQYTCNSRKLECRREYKLKNLETGTTTILKPM